MSDFNNVSFRPIEQQEKMLHLRDELNAVEISRTSGMQGYTINEVDRMLSQVIKEAQQEK